MRQRHMPLGYRMAEGKIVIDPETAEIINRIFQEYSEGASLYQLARKLTEQGALNANHKLLVGEMSNGIHTPTISSMTTRLGSGPQKGSS